MTLQLHHIDSCILLPAPREILGYYRRYMKFSGKKYSVKISIPALGECLMFALKKERSKYEDIIKSIRDITDAGELDICEVKQSHKKIDDILGIDSRLDPTDCSIFACAVDDNANKFITTDKKFLGNSKLENAFNISIHHPNDAPEF